MSKMLVMTFLTSEGKKSSLRVDPVRAGVSDGEVAVLMDLIVSKNVFITKDGYLVKPDGAQIVERTVSKLRVKR